MCRIWYWASSTGWRPKTGYRLFWLQSEVLFWHCVKKCESF